MDNPLILILEDDSRMAETIASIVGLLGYETIIFHKSHEALETGPGEKPDLILLDLNLPDLNGIEVCKRFKDNPETAKTPVIIVSAENHPDTMRAAEAAGASRYLVKPIGLDDLETAIAQTLGESSS